MRCTPAVAIAFGIVAVVLPVTRAQAQAVDSTGGPELSLEQAISIATKNNPDHLQVVEARRTAAAKKRSAYGALLPRADAQLQGLYLKQGNTLQTSGFAFGNGSDVKQSSYFLGLTYNVNTSTFLNPKIESANVTAAEADVTNSVSTVRSKVTQDYFTVLGDQAKAQLEDSLIANAQSQLELAKAKLAVGSGITLDVSKAQVNLGTQEVAAIRARNQVAVDRLTLFQDMGVESAHEFPVDDELRRSGANVHGGLGVGAGARGQSGAPGGPDSGPVRGARREGRARQLSAVFTGLNRTRRLHEHLHQP